ncbi:MAG: ABC transporter permease [Terriglobales bacterium]
MHRYGWKIAAGFLLVVHLVMLTAGFIAPYDPADQDRMHAWAPPRRLHFRDDTGFHLRPFIRDLQAVGFSDYVEDATTKFPVQLFCKGAGYSVVGLFHSTRHLFCSAGPARVSLLGTDGFGRDVFSRLLYGAQISLGAGLLATFLSLAAGLVIGLLAGYRGGWTDEVLMGSSELLLTLPWLYLLLALRAALPLHMAAAESFLLVVCVVSLLGWARPARLVRGVVLSAKARNYVSAARGFGASEFYLVRRHILPAVFAVLLTQAALLVPQYVAAEVTLSFFALGVGEPTPSWGNMLASLQQYQVLTSYWWMLAPAVALIAISISYCFLADTIQTRLQSRST